MTVLYVLIGMALMLAVLALKGRYASFTAQAPEDYAKGPVFNIRDVLNGPIACEGIIYGPLGRVTSRFEADMHAEWNGDTGILTEHFRYDSGSEQTREWTLKVGNDGRIKATAPDVIGDGSGTQNGSAVQLRYRIQLTEDAGGHVLDTVDWMYLTPNGTIMNRSQFRKFGIKVAELVATMRPIRNDSVSPGE